jgi:hypothetical protein
VAQLDLVKTLYRLGEPVQGIIDFEGAVIPTFEVRNSRWIQIKAAKKILILKNRFQFYWKAMK